MYTESIRPWGKFQQYTENETTTVKIITVEPGQKLSVQRHKKRDELWIALDEGLVTHLNGEQRVFHPGTEFYIPKNSTHSIENEFTKPARFLEIAFGHFDENDIERLEDKYGRC